MQDNNNITSTKKVIAQGVLYLLVIIISAFAGYQAYQSFRYDFITLTGEKYQWNQFKGELIIVNYFAKWCAPCLREMPELNALSENLPNHTRLFAIDYDMQSAESISEMAKQFDIRVPLIIPDEKTILPFGRPSTLPTTFIVDEHGTVLRTLQGEVTAAGLRREIASLQLL